MSIADQIARARAAEAASPKFDLTFGHGYEQEDPGWYISDQITGLIVASSDTDPTPEQLAALKASAALSDIYNLILRDRARTNDTE